jgi:hypothetical protein
MTKHTNKPFARIELDLALREQSQTLANLLELYAHDFSEFRSLDIGVDGKFGYKFLPLYWSEPNRHAFFIKVDGRLAGLALVKRGSEITGNPQSGMWRNSSFSADGEDVELGRLQLRKFGDVSRGLGKSVSCNPMS